MGAELKGKLERATDLMSHANPKRELAVVLERALDLLLTKLEKRTARAKIPEKAAGLEVGDGADAVEAKRAPVRRQELDAPGEASAPCNATALDLKARGKRTG